MNVVNTTIATMLTLVALFLVLNNADKTKTVLKALGDFTNPTLRTLQGRDN